MMLNFVSGTKYAALYVRQTKTGQTADGYEYYMRWYKIIHK